MRKLTLLPFALVAACGSEDRCDPFLEAADCARGQTPVASHRYGRDLVRAPSSTAAPSDHGGPSAGSTNGDGPTAGPVGGDGPTAGPVESNGPTAGPVGGDGPTAGSTNPADVLLDSNEAGETCVTFCEAFFGGACADQVDGFGASADQLIEECGVACECLRRSIPECVSWLADVFSECADRGDCGVASECLDTLYSDGVQPPASCVTIQSAIEDCGGESINL